MTDYIKREDADDLSDFCDPTKLNDYIKRRDAFIILEKTWVDGTEYMGNLFADFENIHAADVVEQENRWIPCNKKLPDDYTDVLVWFEYYRFGEYNRMYSTYGIGNYDADYEMWMINHETGWRDLHVFAWMPLPEPYKEGE